MEFKVLDENFSLLSLLAPTSVQWDRKYYEPGEFMIEIESSQYVTGMKYIYCTERPEVGMIQKISWERKNSGKMIELSGFFLEKWLDDRIIYPTFYGRGETLSVLTNMINQYKEDIPLTVSTPSITGDDIDFQATGDELSAKLYEILETQEMSYRIIYDYENDELNLEFFKGTDMTQDSGGDSFVTFSTSWGNLQDPLIDIDDSNYKNFFIVAGTGEAEERITVEVDLSNGEYKKKAFLDKRNTKYDSEEQTLDEYKAELKQAGLEEALDYQKEENISFTIVPEGYEYMVDYDIGTKVDAVIEDLQMSFSMRITEIHEVIEKGAHEIEIEVGTPIKNNYMNIRR